MRELSLNIMDILENSISANASIIELHIVENILEDKLIISISDNGCGIDEDKLKIVTDPFFTSRKSRKVGLGLSLFEAACQRCMGKLEISSQTGKGTSVRAVMSYSHIDRPPIGRIEDTIAGVLLTTNVRLIYKHQVNDNKFAFDSQIIKDKLNVTNLDEPYVIHWIKEYINEGLDGIGARLWL